ncbi:Dimethylaniline monooxygenase [N-oxide-forming] 5 [Nymphon striatum]|nr:Dimethylaniline monooxygenase [N-oxide-forming] 5 [Nymphon striatum]
MIENKKKSVVVIGAGVSGLVSVKSCLEEGLDVRCYELTECVGGLWKYRNDSPENVSVLQKSTIINSSKEMSAFSDFPPPSEYSNFMHNKMMWSYIDKYASQFNLFPYIKLHHKVESCTKNKEGDKWIIKGFNVQTDEAWEDTADALMVCNGHLAKPKIPNIPGLKDFKGKVIHTRDYKHTTGFEDKNILVVGVGNSAGDAAVELSTVSNQLYLCARTGTWVFSRVGKKGIPSDFQLSRLLNFFVNLAPSLTSTKLENDINQKFDHKLFGLKPKHRVLEQHPVVNDDLPNRIISGRIKVKGGIDHVTKDSVYFVNDDTEYKIDVVVLGTGYLIDFPFLDDSITGLNNSSNEVNLYKYIIPPKDPSIAIIGLLQPFGALTPLGEAQARWYVQYLLGKLELPSCETMQADIDSTAKRMRQRFRTTSRYTLEVDFQPYLDDLHQYLGTKPNLMKIFFEDPPLFWKMLVGPILPYQYRLKGPNKWEGARKAIMTVEDRMREPFSRKDENNDQKSRESYMMLIVPVIFGIFSFYYLIELYNSI